MPKKSTNTGTLLYPGVILRGNNIILSPTAGTPRKKTKRVKARTVRSAGTKAKLSKNKRSRA